MTLKIEVPAMDSAVFDSLIADAGDVVVLTKSKRFDGPPDLVQAILVATPILLAKLIPHIAQVISKQIEARRYVTVEYNGFRMKGLNERNAEKLLRQVIRQEGRLGSKPTGRPSKSDERQ